MGGCACSKPKASSSISIRIPDSHSHPSPRKGVHSPTPDTPDDHPHKGSVPHPWKRRAPHDSAQSVRSSTDRRPSEAASVADHNNALYAGTGENVPDLGVDDIFVVLHSLGSGGSACTYLCRDKRSMDLVAVKFFPRPLPKALVQMMMQEIDIQARLGEAHVNIIVSKELVLTRSHLALVMEYAQGTGPVVVVGSMVTLQQ